MDIVLEVFDTFVGDQFYSTILPRSIPSAAKQAFSSIAADATFSSTRELPTPYEYHPATQFFHLEPSIWAYKSAWPRDNPYRQFLSLFAITWYVVRKRKRREESVAGLTDWWAGSSASFYISSLAA
jgi:lathosterol oxidase